MTARDDLLAELDGIADMLESIDDVYARRIAIWEALRAQDPPVTYREIAARSRVSEVAVIQGLRKARERREAS